MKKVYSPIVGKIFILWLSLAFLGTSSLFIPVMQAGSPSLLMRGGLLMAVEEHGWLPASRFANYVNSRATIRRCIRNGSTVADCLRSHSRLPPVPAELPTRDVSYGSDPLQRLDIYRQEGTSNRPVLFLIHGGSWISGDKEHFKSIAEYFRDQGYVAVAINYRLTTEAENAYPIPVNDAACALAWTKQNIARYGGDPSRIVTFGHSAGGHIGALLAYKPEGDWLSGCPLQTIALDVDGFIGSGGVYDFDSIIEGHRQPMKSFLGDKYGVVKWNDAEPSNFVDASDPPALLIAGGAEEYDVIGAKVMANALSDAGVQYRLVTPRGFQHETFVQRLPTYETAQRVVREFLESVF